MELLPFEIEKLVILSQQGQDESFAQLFDHFYPKISRYVSFRVNSDEVEDIVGDIFFKVISKLKKYQPTAKGNFSAWVFRVAHNTVIDFYRSQREITSLYDEVGELKHDFPDQKPNPQVNLEKNEDSAKIREILAKLSPVHQEVLQLKFLEGFSNSEIAEIIGKSEGNVRVIQLRALREMRKHFPED